MQNKSSTAQLSQLQSVAQLTRKELLAQMVAARQDQKQSAVKLPILDEQPDPEKLREFPELFPKQKMIYEQLQKRGIIPKSRTKIKACTQTVDTLEAVYRGDLSRDKKQGVGEAVLEDGSVLAGEFHEDQALGGLTVVSPTGYSFIGRVEPDKDHTCTEIVGDFFPPGNIKEKIEYGIGVVYGDDDTKYIGSFFQGKYASNFRPQTWLWN
jgi:hypothetical protein